MPLCESIYSLNASLVGLGVSPGSGKSENSGQAIKPNCVGLGKLTSPFIFSLIVIVFNDDHAIPAFLACLIVVILIHVVIFC